MRECGLASKEGIRRAMKKMGKEGKSTGDKGRIGMKDRKIGREKC
jgi:hypothetical protein